MADVADWTQAVNVVGGSVSITGTATVTISGTPTVSISGTPNVNISNTPAVTINSGSVTASISGTPNINVQSQSVTINVNQPQTQLADLTFPNTGATTQTTATVPAGTHALSILGDLVTGLTTATIKGHQTSRQYWPKDRVMPLAAISATIRSLAYMIVPVNSAVDTTYDITGTNNSGASITVKVGAVLDSQAVEVSNSTSDPVFVADAFVGGYFPVYTRQRPAAYDGKGLSNPAAGTKATVTLAALGAANGSWIGSLFICKYFSITSAAASQLFANLIDGVSGGATLLHTHPTQITAVAGTVPGATGSELNGVAGFIGTANTAMTAEFSANPIANSAQNVTLGAYVQRPVAASGNLN